MTITFQLEGQEFMALNGGPHFKPHASNFADGELRNPGGDRSILGQALGRGWDATVRLAHGQIRRFLADRPATLAQMMQDDQPEKAEKVMKAILEMEKLDLPTLERAYANK